MVWSFLCFQKEKLKQGILTTVLLMQEIGLNINGWHLNYSKKYQVSHFSTITDLLMQSHVSVGNACSAYMCCFSVLLYTFGDVL
jgi:hypothetical protein